MPRYTIEQILNPDALYSSPSPSSLIYQRREHDALAAVNAAEARKKNADIMRGLAYAWIAIIVLPMALSPKTLTSTPALGIVGFAALLIGAVATILLTPQYKRKQQKTIDKATTPALPALTAAAAEAAKN